MNIQNIFIDAKHVKKEIFCGKVFGSRIKKRYQLIGVQHIHAPPKYLLSPKMEKFPKFQTLFHRPPNG